MDFVTIIEAIGAVGFPAVLAVVFGFIIWKLGAKINDSAAENMKQVQERCKEREEKLYEELAECRKINSKAIETIAHYAEKLDNIQADVKEIKTDLSFLMAGGNKS